MERTVEIEITDLACTIRLLDAAQEALDAAAAREQKREANKRIKEITAQGRARDTRAHVAKMVAMFGIELG